MTKQQSKFATISAVALAALTVGFSVGSLQPQWMQKPPAQTPTIVSHLIPVRNQNSDAVLGQADADAAALHEMNAYAVRHLGVFEDDVNSFNGASDWSPRFQLRWMDVRNQAGDMVRIYHATDRLDGRRRFVAMWSGDEAQPWERAW